MFGEKLLGKAIGMGLLGGITTALQGGKFGHGFAAAGFSTLAGGGLAKIKNLGAVGRVVGKAIIGGTASRITGGKFMNGAATAAFLASVSEASALTTDNTESGSAIEAFGEEEKIEFKYEERVKLREALTAQADELDKLFTAANDGDKTALKTVHDEYGTKVDLKELTSKISKLNDTARNFKSSNFRKLKVGDSYADGRTRAYWTEERVGSRNVPRIFLSKTAYNDVLAGNDRQYTLLHEVAHGVLGFVHNVDNRSFHFQQILCDSKC